MLYAIVSDIHANLQAWTAVWIDLRSLRVDRVVCLGDIVGYGPNPAEVLRMVHSSVDCLVLGNHDAAVCGKMDPALFTGNAREIVLWTRDQLNATALRFLRSLPLSLRAPLFRCAHGEFAAPAAYNYVIDPGDALPSWKAADEHLLFVGHSHVPGIFVLGHSGVPHRVEPQDFVLEEQKRFLVNVGSVGQPRDGDPRASYCLFDAATRAVYWRRVPFDLDEYRVALARAGLPKTGSYFLRHDPRVGRPPVRQLLSFTPAASPEQAVTNTCEVRDLEVMRRQVKRWRLAAWSALGLSVVLCLGASLLWWNAQPEPFELRGEPLVPVSALTAPLDQNLLTLPREPVAPESTIPGWTVTLGHRRRQSIAVNIEKDGPVFVLASLNPHSELRLASPSIRVQPDMRLCLEALFRKQPSFRGTVAVTISALRSIDGRETRIEQFVVKEPTQARAGEWVLAKATFNVPANAVSLDYRIQGRFTGEVQLKDLKLYRKK